MSQLKIKATPVFYANLKAYQQGYPVIVNEGGSRCFYAGQEVVTRRGSVKISELTESDEVLSHCFETGQDEWKKVLLVHEMPNTKRTIKVTLKTGRTIIATEDHLFYTDNGWQTLKQIVDGCNLEADTKL